MPNKFVMKSEGDLSSAELEIESGNPNLVSLESGSDTKSKYPIDYLKKMIKAARIADTVTLQFGQDYPMKMSFKSGDKASLQFILAPRMSDSE
jgi:proliferating cell nuclear antigen